MLKWHNLTIGEQVLNEAVILAGGKSSRMGRDKALLPFAGEETLTLYQYKRLSKIFDRVYISSKNNKFDKNIDIIEDKISDISSPMVALESILSSIRGEAVFILGVDMPFVSKEMIYRLIKQYNKSSKTVIAQSPNGLEPLSAIYPKLILPTIRKLLDRDEHRLHRLLSSIEIEKVRFEDREAFFNMNNPSDYLEALRIKNI